MSAARTWEEHASRLQERIEPHLGRPTTESELEHANLILNADLRDLPRLLTRSDIDVAIAKHVGVPR